MEASASGMITPSNSSPLTRSRGIRNTPPVTASLITGLEPVMNPLLVAAFYGERITALSVIGCVVVVCSILAYNVWLAREKERTA